MDNERRPGKEGPEPLTLEIVAHTAREIALRDGGHAPTIIVEGSAGSVAGQFLELPDTHEGKVRQMFISGYSLGQSGKTGRLEHLYFISEGWMSVAEGERPPSWPPSQDPARKEVLFITYTRPDKGQTRLICFEMVRDSDGCLVALPPFQPPELAEPEGRLASPLLDAFVAGYQAGAAGLN